MLSVGGRKAKASSGLLIITTLFSDQTGRPLGAWAVSSPCNLPSGHSICVAFVCFDGVLSASSTVHRTAYREETSHRVRAERDPRNQGGKGSRTVKVTEQREGGAKEGGGPGASFPSLLPWSTGEHTALTLLCPTDRARFSLPETPRGTATPAPHHGQGLVKSWGPTARPPGVCTTLSPEVKTLGGWNPEHPSGRKRPKVTDSVGGAERTLTSRPPEA